MRFRYGRCREKLLSRLADCVPFELNILSGQSGAEQDQSEND